MTLPTSFIPKPPPGQDSLPCDDGEPMDTPLHRLQMNVLIDSLEDAWAERSDFYVGGNMFVYFSELQIKNNDFRGPDVFVVLNCERKPRKSWVAWEEGGKLPDVVIELLSESTANVDRNQKKQLYARVWRLPEYFLFDPESGELEGYRLNGLKGEYVRIEPEPNGDLQVATLGLTLGVRPGRIHLQEAPFLRWLSNGKILPTEREMAAEQRALAASSSALAEQEKARAEQEKARAESAEARAKALEAELELLRRRGP